MNVSSVWHLDAEASREVLARLQELKTSPEWSMVLRLVERRMAALKNELAARTTTDRLEDVREIQGQITALKWLLGLPEREIKRLALATTAEAESEGG